MHVATHGFFASNECLTGLTDLANPLRLSGLAFATSPDPADALLLAEEVATLNLRDAQWVVLSGCDTGIGQIEVDEGILGLRRAFRVAGAGTLIMSLWLVEDRSAETFMAELYEARLNGGRFDERRDARGLPRGARGRSPRARRGAPALLGAVHRVRRLALAGSSGALAVRETRPSPQQPSERRHRNQIDAIREPGSGRPDEDIRGRADADDATQDQQDRERALFDAGSLMTSPCRPTGCHPRTRYGSRVAAAVWPLLSARV